MENFWKEVVKKRLNKKKVLIAVMIFIIIMLIISAIVTYINNKDARNWIDKNIFRKEKLQNDLPNIEIRENDNLNIYAFNKYIGILNSNKFEIYDNTAKKQNELQIEITKPIYNSNGRFLVIAEDNGKKLYLIEDKNILWEKEIEGNISQVSVNKNGYVAVTIVGTSYKTVIALFDNQGEALFKQLLASTRITATSISNDNKYLAFSEIDTSGTTVQSSVKIVSIENGKNKPAESVIKEFKGENGELITNIKYQDKDKLACMYVDKIKVIKNNEIIEDAQEYGERKISFASIDLSNHSITLEEKSSGIFTVDSILNIVNSDNKSLNSYTTESAVKEVYTANNAIALNMGSQVEFISTNGWLIKRYIAEQEITNIILGDSIAGIIYRDKIEIINL